MDFFFLIFLLEYVISTKSLLSCRLSKLSVILSYTISSCM